MESLSNLTSRITSSLQPKATPETKPTGCSVAVPIGAPKSASGLPAAGSAIGAGQLTPAAMSKLAEKGYLVVEQALAGLLPLRPITRGGLTLGWQVGWALAPGVTVARLRAALAMLNQALLPCPAKTAATELARLSVVTAFREMESPDLVMAEYGRRLAGYPIDAVVDVLCAWPDGNTFFPKWNELRAELELRVEKRRAMKAWIEDELAGKHIPVSKPERFKLPDDLQVSAPAPYFSTPAQTAEQLATERMTPEERRKYWAERMA